MALADRQMELNDGPPYGRASKSAFGLEQVRWTTNGWFGAGSRPSAIGDFEREADISPMYPRPKLTQGRRSERLLPRTLVAWGARLSERLSAQPGPSEPPLRTFSASAAPMAYAQRVSPRSSRQ